MQERRRKNKEEIEMKKELK